MDVIVHRQVVYVDSALPMAVAASAGLLLVKRDSVDFAVRIEAAVQQELSLKERMNNHSRSGLLPAAVTLAASVLSCVALAQSPAALPELDTPANHALFEKSLRAYEAIDKDHSRFATVNGVRMHYLEWGDARGLPLFWSHGYSSTAFELSQVGQGLADMGYHVFAITYRGHGQTQVDNYDFSLADIADDVATLMDQKGCRRAVIGGLSLGGGVTTTFYENYPQRALAIVLEDGGADPVQHRVELQFEQVKKRLAAQAQAQAGRTPRTDRFGAYMTAALPYLPVLMQRPDAGPIFHSFLRQDESGAWRSHIDAQRLMGAAPLIAYDPARAHEISLLAQSWRRIHPIITYRHLGVPMMIIDPTGDDAAGEAFSVQYERLQSLHPQLIRHVKYPDTPHSAHPLRPEWFLRDMKEMLERVRTHHGGSLGQGDSC